MVAVPHCSLLVIGRQTVLVARVRGGAVGARFCHAHLQDGGFVVGTGQQHEVVLVDVYTHTNTQRTQNLQNPWLRWPQGGALTSRTPSASITTVQVPGFSTNGSTKLFWGTLAKAGAALGANTTCLDCSEPADASARAHTNTHIHTHTDKVKHTIAHSHTHMVRHIIIHKGTRTPSHKDRHTSTEQVRETHKHTPSHPLTHALL